MTFRFLGKILLPFVFLCNNSAGADPTLNHMGVNLWRMAKRGSYDQVKARLVSDARLIDHPILTVRKVSRTDSSGGVWSWTNKYVAPLIVRAARKGDLELVKLCIQLKAQINLADSKGRTALHYAVKRGPAHIRNSESFYEYRWHLVRPHLKNSLEMMRLLLENGADTEARTKKYNPTPFSLVDKYEMTPLHIAVKDGYRIAVQILLDHKADIEARDHENDTPLHYAAAYGRIGLLRMLIKNGAHIEAKGALQRTPMAWAALKGRYETVKFLIEAGAKTGPALNTVDIHDQPLIELLIEASTQDDDLDEALKSAALRLQVDRSRLLLEAGARYPVARDSKLRADQVYKKHLKQKLKQQNEVLYPKGRKKSSAIARLIRAHEKQDKKRLLYLPQAALEQEQVSTVAQQMARQALQSYLNWKYKTPSPQVKHIHDTEAVVNGISDATRLKTLFVSLGCGGLADICLGLAPGGLLGSGVVGLMTAAGLWTWTLGYFSSKAAQKEKRALKASVLEHHAKRLSTEYQVRLENDQFSTETRFWTTVFRPDNTLPAEQQLEYGGQQVLLGYKLHKFRPLKSFNKEHIHGLITLGQLENGKKVLIQYVQIIPEGDAHPISLGGWIWSLDDASPISSLKGGKALQFDAESDVLKLIEGDCVRLLTNESDTAGSGETNGTAGASPQIETTG